MKLMIVCVFLLSCLVGTKSYNWMCTEVNRMGLSYIPSERSCDNCDIDSERNQLYIYPLPSNLDCYGDIVAIEYCYRYNRRRVFNWTLLILQYQDSEPGMFRIVDSILLVSHPENATNCSQPDTYPCCDKMNTTRLKLSKGFAYGVTESGSISPPSAPLLGFSDSLGQYQVDTLQMNKASLDLSVNATHDIQIMYSTTGLRMLWFTISSENNSAADDKTTTVVDTPPTSMTSNTSGIVGGVIGGLVGLIAIIAVILLLMVFLIKRRPKKSRVVITGDEQMGYNNAVYNLHSGGHEGSLINGAQNQQTSVKFNQNARDDTHYEYVKSDELEHEYFVLTSNQHGDSQESDSATPYEAPQMLNATTADSAEDIYMDPASDEFSLYTQLSQIHVHTFTSDAIVLTAVLGSGQFGTVHKGEWSAPGLKEKREVAVKTLKEGAGEEDKVKFLQEAAIMGQFFHPNVVKLYGVIKDNQIMLIIELLSNGDLRGVLCDCRSKSSSTLKMDSDLPYSLLSFCRQVAAGMSYLAAKAFVHRDLAARNILLSEDGTCKIADFGMSRDLADTDYYVAHGGMIPIKWTAPEAIHYRKYSTASDVWSYGCVMYEIWSLGHKPFEAYTNQECITIVEGGRRLPPPPGCPRSIYKLMIQCWHPEASGRPDFTSVTQQLYFPDNKLLKWSEADSSTNAMATKLGAELDTATELYKDLQEQYIH